MSYRSPVLLEARHQLDDFRCASEEQTSWLQRHARQSAASSSTRVFVVTEVESDRVVAYYAWCMAQLAVADALERLRRGSGRYPQPVALLARLGVDLGHEGRGLGAGMLKDVIARFLVVAEEIGCRALLVHAESDVARGYYLHLIPEFVASPSDPLHLVLLAKDVRKALASGLTEARVANGLGNRVGKAVVTGSASCREGRTRSMERRNALSSCRFTVWVTDQAQRTVWPLAAPALSAISEELLSPGAAHEGSESWDLRPCADSQAYASEPVPPGVYTVRGYWKADSPGEGRDGFAPAGYWLAEPVSVTVT